MKKFQVIVDMGKGAIINATNKQKEVDEWITTFKQSGIVGSTLKIYQQDGEGYTLIHSVIVPSAEPVERLIGFGRWT